MNDEAKEQLMRGSAQLGVQLSPAQRGKFHQLASELKKWGKKINLTAIKGDTDIAVKHFIDSLTLVPIIGHSGSLLDLGSGAGFPGIPLGIVLPKLRIVSVDAVEKKIIFQRHAARQLALGTFQAVHARGEDLSRTYAGHFDWIVSRAFSDIPTFVKMALPLLREGGTIVAMKGKTGKEEALSAKAALADFGAEVQEVKELLLPLTGDARSFVIIRRQPGL